MIRFIHVLGEFKGESPREIMSINSLGPMEEGCT